MSAGLTERLSTVADLIRRFGLTSLLPALSACEALSGEDSSLDVAVLGQIKSGKSSLLNAVLGEAVFPVGAVPVTAVITRAAGGPAQAVRVTHQNGAVEAVVRDRLAEG
jgi:predicted GTPase